MCSCSRVVTLWIRVQGCSESGKSMSCVLAGRQSPLHNPPGWGRVHRGSLSFGEGFSRAAGHGMACLLVWLLREAEQHIHSSRSTVLVVWEGENPRCFLILAAFWGSREQTLTHWVVFVLKTFCYGYTQVFKTLLQQQNQAGK